MAQKPFKTLHKWIVGYVHGAGEGWASNRILFDGCTVGLMKREKPSGAKDSGWRFFARDDSEKEERSRVEVNIVANIDTDILPHLYEEPGAVFARSKNGPLEARGLLPPPPVIRLTEDWSARIPSCLEGRKDEEKQIFFGLERSVWFSFHAAKKGESPEHRMGSLRAKADPAPVERYEPDHPTLQRFAYLSFENDDGKTYRWGLHASTVDPTGGHLQMYVSLERKDGVEWARRIWDSVDYTGPLTKTAPSRQGRRKGASE